MTKQPEEDRAEAKKIYNVNIFFIILIKLVSIFSLKILFYIL